MKFERQDSQAGPQWQYNSYRLLLGPIGLVFGVLGLIFLGGLWLTGNPWYLGFIALLAVMGTGTTLWILHRLPRGWRGSWSLDIFYEAEHAVQKSERLWEAVLEGVSAKGLRWEPARMAEGTKAFPRAHDPIEFPREKARLWFDNSPSIPDADPSIVRVVFLLEPLEGSHDASSLRQLIVDSLMTEENRQRAERLAAARKL